MGIVEAISNVAAAIKSFFGFATQKDSEKNAAPIVQSKEANAEAKAVDKSREAIKDNDLDEIRKEAAE